MNGLEQLPTPEMPNIGTWKVIPQAVQQIEYAFRANMVPQKSILAALEAVYTELRLKVNYHMFYEDSGFILKYGPMLCQLDSYLEKAGDSIIKAENPFEGVNELLKIFPQIKSIWNNLHDDGFINGT